MINRVPPDLNSHSAKAVFSGHVFRPRLETQQFVYFARRHFDSATVPLAVTAFMFVISSPVRDVTFRFASVPFGMPSDQGPQVLTKLTDIFDEPNRVARGICGDIAFQPVQAGPAVIIDFRLIGQNRAVMASAEHVHDLVFDQLSHPRAVLSDEHRFERC
jgi:hypothetical protein